MKAIVQKAYGSPTLLKIQNVERPFPKSNEVLVRIHASAVNDYDWSMVRGKPWIYRLMFGFSKPKNPVPGMELAGTVESLGPNTSSFNIGDEVYGDTSEFGFGTFAEYMCINEKALILKPESMSFEEATAIPHAAMLAYQGLIDCGDIKQGQKILMNGAGGGMGTFAVQIAKQYNTHVTGVDTGQKLEMMQSIGFDEVIDYKKEDFTRNGERYDLILDAKTNRSPFAFTRSLSKGGKYVTVGGSLWRMLQLLFLKRWIKITKGLTLKILGLKPNKDLASINELYEKGNIKAVIDGPYEMDEIPRLIQYFGEGLHSGKIVVRLR